ncbi:MAG: bacteriochlorophyll c-binding protein [Candidatus Thermochlorobacter aerophilum]|jgi:chlorosome envelope protein A|uniref:Bacteriochlorophyll c-binding protein n=1 Tax=Candidatus Thermochlorobacter aerophilus TaxID=1868324 RepID=A0A395M4A7_9BACT|nr:MAG: bacteriochlorophyll c-binding protein [Candidatus Thermochlorobacter aerophilum]
MPAGGGGVITDVLISIGRISEYMFEGHWYTGGQIFDALAKGTLRLNQNLYGGLTGGSGALRGSSPFAQSSSTAARDKEITERFGK